MQAQPTPYDTLKARLDALLPMRDAQPERLLDELAALAPRWPRDLPEPQASLLRAQRAQLAAGAHFWLTAYQAAEVELDAAPVPDLPPAEPLHARAQTLALHEAHLRAFIAERRSDFPQALRRYHDALERARILGNGADQAQVLGNLAACYEQSGLAEQAIEFGRPALALAQDLGLSELETDLRFNLGNALAAAGQGAEGLAAQRDASRRYAQLGHLQKAAMARIGIAERLQEMGDAAAALAEIDAPGGLDGVGPYPLAYAAGLRAAILEHLHGPGPLAQQAHETALQQARLTSHRAGEAKALSALARIALVACAPDVAWQHAMLAVRAIDGSAAARETVDAHETAARVAEARGDLASALLHQRRMHEAHTTMVNERAALQARMLAVRYQLDMARAEAQRQRLENARLGDALAEVASRLRALESNKPAATVDGPEALRALGLTLREAQVLYWVSQGKTNEDVAAILATGMPAVKKHLGRIYDKLGVENRTAAAATARRRVTQDNPS